MSGLDINAIVEQLVKDKIAKCLGVSAPVNNTVSNKTPVIVCTDKRGVFFGYTSDYTARPIVLSNARMCLYWDKKVGGVTGLGDIGPQKESRIAATVPQIILEGVTAVLSVSPVAEKAWLDAPVQGR